MEAELFRLYQLERERICLLQGSIPEGDFEHPVFGEGPLSPKLLFLGEAPGAEEAKSGRPFVGKAGRQLDQILEQAQIKREEVFVTNTVKYRPIRYRSSRASNRPPTGKEIEASLPMLQEELGLVRPRWIATLGNTPLSAIAECCGLHAMKIGQVHGRCFPLS